jgi:hypothetical protein
LPPSTIPSPSEFRKAVSRASHSVELHDDGCDERLPIHITDRIPITPEFRLTYFTLPAGSVGSGGRAAGKDLLVSQYATTAEIDPECLATADVPGPTALAIGLKNSLAT